MQIPYRKPGKFTNLVQDPHITEAKALEIEKKLDRLKNFVRPKQAEEVALLAQGGDFSENAGYQAAKGRLRSINEKIINFESQLRRAIIIKPKKHSLTVELGSTVTISDGSKQKIFTILGSMETDPQKGVISQNSPLGEKLMGCGVGDEIDVVIGKTTVKYTILQIS